MQRCLQQRAVNISIILRYGGIFKEIAMESFPDKHLIVVFSGLMHQALQTGKVDKF